MIDSQGRLLCDSCQAKGGVAVMGRLQERTLILLGRHHGERHMMAVSVFDLLPEPGTAAYGELVAELLRRVPGQ